MKNKIKKLVAMLCAFSLIGGIAVFGACGNGGDETHTTHIDTNSDGKCDECGTDVQGGLLPGGDVNDPGAILSTFSAYPDSKDELIASIKTHESETATYRFEAECTDLRGKSGPAWSGTSIESSMATAVSGSRTEGCVGFLGEPGLTVNFLVVSDRAVDDAVLTFCLGAERMDVPVNADVFTVRVDDVTQEDLYPVTEDGALGAWDLAFLVYNPTPDQLISSFECPADSVIEAEGTTTPSNFSEYLITSKLSLKEGVNSISLVITGMALDDGVGEGSTLSCKSPCIDYMKITTSAQLGFFDQQNNGYGTDGLSIV